MSPNKTDNRLALGYGSAWHLLRCLGWRRKRFNQIVAAQLGVTNISWIDFPPRVGSLCYSSGAVIRDDEWKRIAFLGDEDVERAYDDFWPARGSQQNWDAIGRADFGAAAEWLLVEAKAHPDEMTDKGTTAEEGGGRPKIRAAFQETLAALGFNREDATARAEQWLTGYYQYANRLATLHFFTERKIPARLVLLYFCGDEHPREGPRPANPADWKPHLDELKKSLGLRGVSELEKRVHEVFVDVNLASEFTHQGCS
jgi:hypothetical protein